MTPRSSAPPPRWLLLPGAVDRSESYGHCDDSGSSLGCTYDLRPYCWLYQGRPRPPKELVFGGVIIVKDGEKEVLFIDIKKKSGAKLEKTALK